MLDAQRVEKLARELSSNGIDAIYIGPSTDLEYMAQLQLFDDQRTKGLVLTKEGKAFALVPLLYEQEMRHALGANVAYKIWSDHEGFKDAFKSGCEELGLSGKKVAINDGVRATDLIDMKSVVDAEYINGARTLSPLRVAKDERELAYMRRASEIADSVMDDVSKFMKPGMIEREVKEFLIRRFTERGGEGLSFSPIVASGPGGSMPHYRKEDREIICGDFVIIDMGCRYNGYCSDITRTFCIGDPSDEQKKIYDIVLEAQKAGESAVRPGATGQDVDRAARRVIADAGYGKYFINRLGHGIGIAVHESPYIIEGNDVPLGPGNVFSIEPGIYLEGKFGVRIENLVAIRPDGTGEALNKFPREMIVIK